jgi:CheY-like chemotaxis protein
MKTALVLEKDPDACQKISQLLQWLGYMVAPVFSVDKALNVAKALNFDLIFTYVAKKANDRRSLSAELRRTNPDALVVFVVENENDYIDARFGKYPGYLQ